MYCITCPTGCKLSVEQFGESIKVEGNECNRGVEFAETEIRNPTRSLTTTVRTTFPGVPVLPVRTEGEIPKGKIMEAMAALNKIVVGHELDCGDTVVANLVGTGVRVIATSDAIKRREQQYSKQKKQRPGGGSQSGDQDALFEDEMPDEEEELIENADIKHKDDRKPHKHKGRPHIKRGSGLRPGRS